MDRVTQTVGDIALDAEIDNLYRLIQQLQPKPAVTPPPVDTGFVPSTQIEVKTTDASYDNFVDGIEVDQNIVSDSSNLAKLTLEHNLLADPLHGDTLAGTVVKGDLVAGNATPKWSRIGVGSNGQVLTADSTAGQGMKWAAASGGTNALLDGTNHTDTVAQTVVKGALVVGNNTPKWDELTVGSDAQVLTADSTQTKGVKWAAIPASGGGGLANFSAMRWRAYQSGIGSNITGIDSAFFAIAGVSGTSQPGGVTQANFRHDSAILRGMEGNQWVMWGRLKVTVANQPKTVSWFVPNVDDNFYAVFEQPSIPRASSVTCAASSTAVTGTSTLFLTDFAVGDAIRFSNGEVLYISAIADNTHLTLARAFTAGTIGGTYRVCKKVYEAHNQVAQTPVNQKSTISLTVNGDWILHLFSNNDGNTQGAFNFATNLVDDVDFVLGDVGSETF